MTDRRCCRGRDHPRRCGEHSSHRLAQSVWLGSSPQMRGAQLHATGEGRIGRIIPADAGSTPGPVAWPDRRQDHPRRCGEHLLDGLPDGRVRGSSPQMRGAPNKQAPIAVGKGIIPADAGSTAPWMRLYAWREDHPRRCGEHLLVGGGDHQRLGSSPQMRGARRR